MMANRVGSLSQPCSSSGENKLKLTDDFSIFSISRENKVKFSTFLADDLYVELWKACAGPLVDVPKQGERVYYFPQGHMEQVRVFLFLFV